MSSKANNVNPLEAKLQVRTFQPRDQAAVSRLYTEGLLAGQIAANDTGADIENIHEAYFEDDESHFWIAEVEENIVGMIGVARDQEHTAEIRRLRVDPQFKQSVIGAKLIETALAHCKHHGYLKVVLDTRFDPDAVLDLFDRFGFQHTRTKSTDSKDLLEFYLDLYREPKKKDE
jgi:N-acetylglutamate synthase-like GNAT family acetyltransferase